MRNSKIGRYAMATLLAAGIGSSPAAAAGRPDLGVASVKGPAGSLAAGAPLSATLKVRNSGSRRAGGSTLALYLARGARHARTDTRLGKLKVAALKPRATSRRTLRTRVPAGAPAARYHLIACADSAGRVKERSERNNCRAAKGTVTITAAPAAPLTTPIVTPAPVPAPAGAPEQAATPRDADGDGFGPGADCNDADAAIHPGATDAPEMTFTDANCDGIDGDESRAVFVSLVGSDGNPGTRTAPVQNITVAVERAQAAHEDVYVMRGTYDESVGVANGVGIYGGYDLDWSRSTTVETRIRGSQDTGLIAYGLAARTTVQLVTIAAGGHGAGRSSIGVSANGSPGLVLEHVAITALPGVAGGAGQPGASGVPGATGLPGGSGSCDGPGAGGGGGPTGLRTGRQGGEGGAGGSDSGGSGKPGQAGAGTGGGAGGAGGAAGDPGHDGATGHTGASGHAGVAGAGGGPGSFNGSQWLAPPGRPGTSGTDGFGGGGGGGSGGQDCTLCDNGAGNGGGEGGDGGERGYAGREGGGGGASIGVLLVDSPGAIIRDSTVTAAGGGAGGDGGAGGKGAPGGGGGDGSGHCSSEIGHGGNGGAGGAGGDAGAGGGGTGGPSFAILLANSPGVALTGDTLTHGAGGAGGHGGTGGNAGQPGPAQDVANG